MESKTKIPQQKRSIEKRDKIIRTGIELFAAKGYYNITTDEIAVAAGVSTGIVYRYFADKKEILLAGIKLYFEEISERFFGELSGIGVSDMTEFLGALMDFFITLHRDCANVHNEIEAMRHYDKDVDELYKSFLGVIHEKLSGVLPDELTKSEHFNERMMLAVLFMESSCHLIAENDDIDSKYVKETTIAYVSDIMGRNQVMRL